MKLFESSWFENYRYYERCLTASGKSECFEIPSQYEYFIPDPKGKYHLITDQTAALTRMEGNSKHAKGNYGVTTPVYKNIRDSYWRDGSYNLEPRTIYLDIETRALNPPPDPVNVPETITLIQMLDSKTKQIIVLGLREWHEEPDYTLEYPVKYIKCDSELVLMQNFLKIFKVMNPLIIYAWNGEGFDFPYLYYRLKKLGLDPNGLSNYGTVRVDYTENLKTHQKSYKLTAPGHYYLDMMAVYKKYVLKPRPSYSLDSIAEIEVHCNKVEHDEFPTFDSFYTGEKYTIQDEPFQERIRESIRQGFIRRKSLDPSSPEYAENEKNILKDINFQFVYYGVRDVVLLKKIDDKLNFTNITVNIAKTMGVLHNDVLSTVKPWSQYISNVAFYDGLAMPKKEDHEHSSFEGAYVHDPVRGRHKWVMNFDVNSMYPQYSIAGFGMSPETMISDDKMPGDLKAVIDRYFKNKTDDELLNLTEDQWNEVTPLLRKYNFSLTANGVCYSKDTTGIIPKLTNQIYDGRKLDKKTMFKYEQAYVNAEKIINENSASGSESHELKDPLTYTEDDLKSLTVDDLRKFIVMAHDGADRYNTEQMTKKILINALYGATGEPHFSLYNKNYAAGITANGRFFIKQTAIMLEKKLQELLPWDKNYWLYSDTDSTVASTVISTDKGPMTIEDLYNAGTEETEYRPGKFIRKVSGIKSLSYNTFAEQPEYKPVKYAMKHTVKKRMFKIKCNGKEVVITNDHSLMIKRGDDIIEVKPFEIQENDKLLVIKNEDKHGYSGNI